jgi:hypothetical protein
MEGHPARGQRFKDVSYVRFWSACDRYMKIGKGKVDKLLQKLKHHFPGRWDPGGVGRFIKCVHDQVDWTLIRECEHLLQASSQIVVTRLFGAFFVGIIKTC